MAISTFLAGFAIILLVEALCAVYVKYHPGEAGRRRVQLPESSSLILSVLVMIPLCIGLHLTKQLCTQPGLYWTVSASPLQKLGNEDTWINCATFGLAVFFIMMMDIAGSPIEYVRAGSEGEYLPAEKKNSIIKYSLWIDSGFNIVAPLVGVSPIVYYAENHVGKPAAARPGPQAPLLRVSCSSRLSARFRSTTTGLFPN
jgi:hypothetical protein